MHNWVMLPVLQILCIRLMFTITKQGPVVQSIVSLTSSLRGQLLSVLDLITKYIEIFCWKNEKSLKLLTFFQQKILAYLRY